MKCDCEVLYRSLIKYDEILAESLGWSILKNNVMTTASLAERLFFGQYYKGGLYSMPSAMMEFCQRGYKGGLTDNFQTGVFDRVISADINSSYPHQMTKAPLPVGKAFQQTFNRRYAGEPLLEGIYHVIVISTPLRIKYPIISVIVDGKLTFPHLENAEVYITKEELVESHKRGYRIHLIDAVVCERTANVYGEYISTAYQNRRDLKAKMKQALKDGDNASYVKYNIAQEIEKIKMNSTYGKLGWSKEHDVSNFITFDVNFLLEQFAMGNITSVSKINDRYSSYSGIQVSGTARTNFMLASYITARGRLQIIDALERFDAAGYKPIYSDTDSIYAQVTDKVTKESFDQYVAPLLDDSRLGAMKLEMADNVGEDEAVGAFVALKLYALRGPTTGKEKIVARGIMKWMMSNDKESFARRREQEGQELITFDHIAAILSGMPLEITRQQTLIRKTLLKTNVDNIKIQREMTTTICGAINKKLVKDNGECVPIFHDGKITVPEVMTHESRWMQFPKIETIETHFSDSFDELASRYCVIRNETSNVFIVFMDPSSIPEYLAKFNGENKCHQLFGKWIMPTFDIDCIPLECEDIDTDINEAIRTISKTLGIEASCINVVNRSRQVGPDFKYSFHITAPRYCIQRDELRVMVEKLKNDDRVKDRMTLINFIDQAIYRSKGSLRISDSNVYYRTELLQLSFYSKEHAERVQKIQDRQAAKLTMEASKSVQEAAEDFLKKKGIVGWKFRCAKAFKTQTIVNFDRQSNAKSYCDICQHHHTKDNTLFLKMTAKRIELCCLKNRSK